MFASAGAALILTAKNARIWSNASIPACYLQKLNFVFIALMSFDKTGEEETAVLLQRNDQKGVMVALPVVKGRVRRDGSLMTTPLTEFDLKQGDWLRAVAAWGAWLAQGSC